MADKLDVKVLGYPELARGSLQLADHVGERADEQLGRVGDQVAAATAARVPRRTGRLAAGVGTRATPGGVEVGHVGGVPYAGWVEFGGRGARPYIPGGRFLFPVGGQAEPAVTAAGTLAAQLAIRETRWPRPTMS